MKSGASDPFADDEPTGTGEEQAEPADTDESTEDERTETEDSQSAESPTSTATSDQDTGVTGLSREELPFILRREKVKDERPEVHQLFVQAETHEQAVEAERELEDMLDVDLSRTDAREAIYLAGMANLDEAAAVLRRWGYDM